MWDSNSWRKAFLKDSGWIEVDRSFPLAKMLPRRSCRMHQLSRGSRTGSVFRFVQYSTSLKGDEKLLKLWSHRKSKLRIAKSKKQIRNAETKHAEAELTLNWRGSWSEDTIKDHPSSEGSWQLPPVWIRYVGGRMEIHRRSREFRRMAKYPVYRDHWSWSDLSNSRCFESGVQEVTAGLWQVHLPSWPAKLWRGPTKGFPVSLWLHAPCSRLVGAATNPEPSD